MISYLGYRDLLFIYLVRVEAPDVAILIPTTGEQPPHHPRFNKQNIIELDYMHINNHVQ